MKNLDQLNFSVFIIFCKIIGLLWSFVHYVSVQRKLNKMSTWTAWAMLTKTRLVKMLTIKLENYFVWFAPTVYQQQWLFKEQIQFLYKLAFSRNCLYPKCGGYRLSEGSEIFKNRISNGPAFGDNWIGPKGSHIFKISKISKGFEIFKSWISKGFILFSKNPKG